MHTPRLIIARTAILMTLMLGAGCTTTSYDRPRSHAETKVFPEVPVLSRYADRPESVDRPAQSGISNFAKDSGRAFLIFVGSAMYLY